MLKNVTKSLAAIKTHGGFASRSNASPDDLRIEVKGVGAIRFPVSATAARKLRGIARPAGFGWRDKTRVDKGVRDTWEIARSRVKIDGRKWKRTLDPQLERFRQELGLPEGGKLEARLYKMLVYGPEQFFVPHQDSERAGNMVGTLTVALPSKYKGGSVVIEHHDDKVTFGVTRKSAEQLTFIAFYADCHHEVRPIKAGYRVVLVYNLLFHAPALAPASSDDPVVSELARHVDSHFTTPLSADRYSKKPGQPPDRLVYLLDHEYTQHSLGWATLKSGDTPRAAALRAAADQLDCEIFLALADVHESWSCEGDYDDWNYRRHRYDDDDEVDKVDERDTKSYDLIEMCDGSIDLRHWIDASGQPVKNAAGAVSWDELCFTKASVDCEPFRSEHEGWMGNYGNTVDRWYHRAAIVLWPRSRSFVIRAKLSPAWAVDQLRRLLKANQVEAARTMADLLAPFWSRYAASQGNKSFVAKTLQAAVALDDADQAATLLAPFRLPQLGARAIPPLVALVEAHGVAWCRDLYLKWARRDNFGDHRDKHWLKLLPRLCEALRNSVSKDGRLLAHSIVTHQWSIYEKDCKNQLKDPADPHALSQLTELSKKLIWVLESCVAAGSDDVHADIMRFLTAPKPRHPVTCLVTALEDTRKRCSSKALKELELGVLHRHCTNELTTHLATSPRASDNWSIDPPYSCRCGLCKELTEFLAHHDRVRFEWPLASEKRMHVHGQLGGYNLPVTHTTRRRGRPYTLVLTKTKKLFARDKKLRQTQQRQLAWLAQQRGNFVGTDRK